MKCYARNLGNCSRISSREHFISEAVLEIEGTSIEISGFPWQNKGESAVIGKSSLASKYYANIIMKNYLHSTKADEFFFKH